jgi:hypothetical protein
LRGASSFLPRHPFASIFIPPPQVWPRNVYIYPPLGFILCWLEAEIENKEKQRDRSPPSEVFRGGIRLWNRLRVARPALTSSPSISTTTSPSNPHYNILEKLMYGALYCIPI